MIIHPKVLLLVFLVRSNVFATDTFFAFEQKYAKVYQNEAEASLREKIFNENLEKIEEHNKKYQQGLESYEIGVNQFTDLTQEEFKALLTLQPLSDTLLKQMKVHNSSEFDINDTIKTVDWREKNIVTRVKNQGSCGSCWAFATTGTIESRFALKTGTLVSLSEQQLVDCNVRNSACNGGSLGNAMQYVTKNGLTTEDLYSYKAVQGTCNASNPVAAYVNGYTFISSGNERDILNAVQTGGPVVVVFNADQIQSYSNGIFDSTSCSQTVNHACLVVGYVDNTTDSYWIIKNSWGSSWGESGYFRMAMGKSLCGITSQPIYPTEVLSAGGIGSFNLNYNTCLLGLLFCFLWNLFE